MYRIEAVTSGLGVLAVGVNNSPLLDGSLTQYTVNTCLLIAIGFLYKKWNTCEKLREEERSKATSAREKSDEDHAKRLDEKDRVHQTKIDDMLQKVIDLAKDK